MKKMSDSTKDHEVTHFIPHVVMLTMSCKGPQMTEEEALKTEGILYRHYKGGIYKFLMRGVEHTENGELGVLYLHLWPHERKPKFRPESLFFGKTEDGKERFVLIKVKNT